MNIWYQRAIAIASIIGVSLVLNRIGSMTVSEFTPTLLGAIIAGMFIGSCSAQINLIALWASMSAGTTIVRLPWVILLTLLIMLTWLPERDAHTWVVIATTIGIAQLVTQVPFRVASWARGYRVGFLDSRHHAQGSRQFGIKSVMIGTALVALTLSLLRFFLPDDLSLFALKWRIADRSMVLIPVVITNLLTIWPSIWLAFRSENRLSRIALKLVPFLVLAAAVELSVMIFMVGAPPGEGWLAILLLLITLNVTQSFGAFAVIRILRRFGFRLTNH